MSLQIYINPCLFWLSNLSYTILGALRLIEEASAISKDALQATFSELSAIFSSEFILEDNFEKSFEILTEFGVFQKFEEFYTFKSSHIAKVILSSFAPFMCIYLQLVDAILEEVSFLGSVSCFCGLVWFCSSHLVSSKAKRFWKQPNKEWRSYCRCLRSLTYTTTAWRWTTCKWRSPHSPKANVWCSLKTEILKSTVKIWATWDCCLWSIASYCPSHSNHGWNSSQSCKFQAQWCDQIWQQVF